MGFVTLTRFNSLDAIGQFAGDDYDVPVLEPQALALLSRYDERAAHFESFFSRYERGTPGRLAASAFRHSSRWAEVATTLSSVLKRKPCRCIGGGV